MTNLNIAENIGRDTTPFFFKSGFDLSLCKIKRAKVVFDFFGQVEMPNCVKKIYNFLEAYTTVTHFGVFTTHSCILVDDLKLKLLKDEKTIISYIRETIDFFEENKLLINGKQYKFFDDLTLIKSDLGWAVKYSFSYALTQLIKTDLTKRHFVELYNKQKNENLNENSELADFLFATINLSNQVDYDLANKVFALNLVDLDHLVKTSNHPHFTQSEINVLQLKHMNNVSVQNNDYVLLNSWIDTLFSKDAESNLYQYFISKITKQKRHKYLKSKDFCTAQINITNLRKILGKTSKVYDNYAVKQYLMTIIKKINDVSDIKVGVDTKKQANDLVVNFLIVLKNTQEIKLARLNALNHKKIKRISSYSIKHKTIIKRQYKTDKFYHMDKNQTIKQTEYVIFNDLIRNPKIQTSHAITTASKLSAPIAAESKSSAAITTKSKLSTSNTINLKSKIHSQKGTLSTLEQLEIIRMREEFKAQKFVFDKDTDAFVLNISNLASSNITISTNVFDKDNNLYQFNNQEINDLITIDNCYLSIKRVLFSSTLRKILNKSKNDRMYTDQKLILSINYRNRPFKDFLFDYKYVTDLLAQSMSIAITSSEHKTRLFEDFTDGYLVVLDHHNNELYRKLLIDNTVDLFEIFNLQQLARLSNQKFLVQITHLNDIRLDMSLEGFIEDYII